MDIDINSILNHFVTNFVAKDIKERSALQLKDKKDRAKFTERLNHEWSRPVDMKYVTGILPGV